MSGVFGNPWLFNSDDSFYTHTIDQSLRFNNEDSAKLYFDPTQDGDKQKWTWSGWVKRGNLGLDYGVIFAGVNSSGHQTDIRFEGEDTIRLVTASTALSMNVITTRVFRDTSSWYHIVVAIDTTQTTLTDRFKVYVNGVQETSFSATTCTKDHNCIINTASNVTHNIGANGYTTSVSSEFDGYLAEINFIDGTQLTPASFGETSEGVWIPKEYTGSYGTNGFYLTFQGTGTATTTQGDTAQINIGDDQSGTGNNFTVINSVAEDVMPDSPTNNFATLNPLAEDGVNIKTAASLSKGNLVTAAGGFGSGSPWGGGQSTIAVPTDKKIYCEMLCSNAAGASWFGAVSIPELSANSTGSSNTGQIAAYNRSAMINGVETDYGSSAGLGGLGVASLASGDILQIAVDGATGKVWFGRNGTYFKSPSTDDSGTTGDPAAGTHEIGTITNPDGKPLFIVVGGASATVHVNFGADSSFAGQKTSGSANAADSNGNGEFYYTPPTDYLSLCTKNLASPSIGPQADSLATDHFNTLTYTGNTGTLEVDGLNFRPDFLWIKRTDAAQNFSNGLLNSVRGNTKGLYSSRTNSEFTSTGSYDLQSFDDDGFTIGQSNQFSGNDNGGTFAAWSWKAGGTAPTKTYKVVVDNDGANKYRFRNSANSATFATYAPTVTLQEGGTYVFDWSDDGTNSATGISAQSHPIRFSTTSNGTWGGGAEYTTGVVKDDSAFTTTITVAAGAPTLYYYCQYHSGMGGQVNTNSTFGSTNFNGTLLSVESVNETAGLSILTYSGSLSSSGTASVGHDLGAKPSAIISKSLDNSGADSGAWIIWHDSLPTDNYVLRFDNAAESNKSGNGDMASLFTATTFGTNYTVGSNVTGNDYIAYLFREIPQYSKFGLFHGNSNSDGTYVFCDFRVAFLLVKSTVSGSSWLLYDNKRNGFNVQNRASYAAGASGQASDDDVDLLSNGFKWRRSSPNFNQTGYSEYIYFAIGDQAYKFCNAR